MSAHTSFHIGGPADIFAQPVSVDALIKLLKLAADLGVHVELVGAGTNLLVRDGGVRGVVISTRRLCGVKIAECGSGYAVIEAECGVPLPSLAVFARENSLSGLEFAQGIPGTLGGALCMNAGAYGGVIGELVESVYCCDLSGNAFMKTGAELEFGYRKSVFSRGDSVALSTRIRLVRGEKDDISALMESYAARRRETQPLDMPSAGSTFKRPEGHFAGKLISDAGLKGTTVGGAQVSRKHAGFVVNIGNATAADVLNLCGIVADEVKRKFDVELEREIRVIGED